VRLPRLSGVDAPFGQGRAGRGGLNLHRTAPKRSGQPHDRRRAADIEGRGHGNGPARPSGAGRPHAGSGRTARPKPTWKSLESGLAFLAWRPSPIPPGPRFRRPSPPAGGPASKRS
jgi:hypothetical protein